MRGRLLGRNQLAWAEPWTDGQTDGRGGGGATVLNVTLSNAVLTHLFTHALVGSSLGHLSPLVVTKTISSSLRHLTPSFHLGTSLYPFPLSALSPFSTPFPLLLNTA